jgi:hypothetical protein
MDTFHTIMVVAQHTESLEVVDKTHHRHLHTVEEVEEGIIHTTNSTLEK